MPRRIKKKDRASFCKLTKSVRLEIIQITSETKVKPTKIYPKLILSLKIAYKAIRGKGNEIVLMGFENLPSNYFSE